MGAEKENPHKFHRKRLKEKFMKYGLDALEDHEFLELILFYAIPMKNTNEMAHDLINEFGSFKDILEADIENLEQIEGLSEHSALLFKIILASANKYINSVNNIANARLTPENINIYVKNLFYGHTNEVAYVLLLDKDCVVRKVKKMSQGTVNATPLYPREVVKLAVNERYPYMIIAHNHPGGSPIPSKEDLYITKTIELALNFVDVRLVDHIIVAGERVVSIAKHFHILEK
ncbi:MAG: DNA repair protein RadC [Clostridiales bacterium]|nr:DNA repair protein RadC [Clostridiales bacterium]